MTQKLSTVLAVDLDHTLIDTDMIFLGIKYLILHKIYLLPVLVIILLIVLKEFNYVTYFHIIFKFNLQCIFINEFKIKVFIILY